MKVFVTLLLAVAATFAIADVPETNTESFHINKVGDDPNGPCYFNPSLCRPGGGRTLREEEDGPAAAPAPLTDVRETSTESFDINKVGDDPNGPCYFNPSLCRPGGGRTLREEEDRPAAAPAPLL